MTSHLFGLIVGLVLIAPPLAAEIILFEDRANTDGLGQYVASTPGSDTFRFDGINHPGIYTNPGTEQGAATLDGSDNTLATGFLDLTTDPYAKASLWVSLSPDATGGAGSGNAVLFMVDDPALPGISGNFASPPPAQGYHFDVNVRNPDFIQFNPRLVYLAGDDNFINEARASEAEALANSPDAVTIDSDAALFYRMDLIVQRLDSGATQVTGMLYQGSASEFTDGTLLTRFSLQDTNSFDQGYFGFGAAQSVGLAVDAFVISVPEPASLGLLAIGGLVVLRRDQ